MNTKELFGMENPWEYVAAMYDPNNLECLYGDQNNYVCAGDCKVVDDYNQKVKDTSDEIITKIPAEPWWGNPLKARLIILSLNPGYVPEVNETLAKLLQTLLAGVPYKTNPSPVSFLQLSTVVFNFFIYNTYCFNRFRRCFFCWNDIFAVFIMCPPLWMIHKNQQFRNVPHNNPASFNISLGSFI